MELRIIFWLAMLPAARGQVLMEGAGGPVRLLPTDAAILEGYELRTDLTCKVKAISPELGFDLGLHSGYEVNVPFEEVAVSGNELTAIFRVMPEGHPDRAIHFSQRWRVPPIAEDTRGTVTLRGSFVLGQGKYRVEWLMRDLEERYCSAHWQISADARGKDKLIELRMAPGTAAPEPAGLFGSETPVMRDADHTFKVLVLLHIASQAPGAMGMHTKETEAVLSILRSIAREPRIGSYSITAFNLERNAILFRGENTPQVDFPALGEAIKHLQLGTIDMRMLRQNDSEIRFLSALLAEEMEKNHPDALIFVGPKTAAESDVRGALTELGEPHCPVFYLNYIADPASNPWRDLIGSVVKLWNGFEYSISKPRDLFVAWNEVMLRISNTEPVPGGPGRAATVTGLMPKK